VPGIDYDGVPDSLRARAVEPGDADYARVRSNYLRGGSPGLVLRPRGVDEVRDALAFARRHPHVPLGVRSRGHGVSGRSTNHGGIVIDLKDLDAVEVTDPGRRLVRAQPGARWLDVARALAPHGLAISSGDYGGVGVGGLATAGGIGWLAREHGLTIDHLRGADVLLADGSLVRADAAQNPDLFWAIRGAGANFGIVTAFDFEAAPVQEIAFAVFAFDASDTAGFIERWGAALEAAPRAVSGEFVLAGRSGGRRAAQAMLVVEAGDPDPVLAALQPIAQIAPLVDQVVQLTT
jgi:FAD/FMN-containing dehydrogenase